MLDDILQSWKQDARQAIYLRPWLHWTILEKKPISLLQATELFDQLASNKYLNFDNSTDSCNIRAHFLCEEVMDMGMRAFKAWVFAETEVQENENEGKVLKPISVILPDGKLLNEEGWAFHVALALPVQMPDSRVAYFVFDPTLFDGPIPAQEWARAMKVPDHRLDVTVFGKTPVGHRGDYNPMGKTTKAILRSPTHSPTRNLITMRFQKKGAVHVRFHSPYRIDKPTSAVQPSFPAPN